TLELDTVDRSIALSPDGAQVALVLKDTVSGVQQIYLRPLDRLEANPLAGTTGASYPFWSPDGKSIGFFADLKLKRLDLAGGIVRTLSDAPAGRGAAWSPHGFIVFAPSANGALFQVPEEGGEPQTFTTQSSQGENHRLPHFLPDGRGIIYSVWGLAIPDASQSAWTSLDAGIAVFGFHPDTGVVRKILDSATEAFYAEPGYLAYVQDSNLMLQPFDPVALEPTGEPQPIAVDVHYDVSRLYLQLDLVAGGTLVYGETPQLPAMRLGWLDRRGEQTPIPAEPISLTHARVSPDGRRAAIAINEPHGSFSVVLIDLERGIRTRINPPGSFATHPAWSRDGNRLAFQSLVGSHYQSMVLELRPGEAPIALTKKLDMASVPDAFTRDGKILFSLRSQADKRSDLMLVDTSGESPPTPLLAGPTNDSDARLSPNGQWVVFGTFPAGLDPSTGFEAIEGATLSITDYPTTGRWQITRPDAAVRTWGWLSDTEIYWQDAERKVWVVSITPHEGGAPTIGAAQQLFENQTFADDGSRIVDYSITREQFLVIRPAGSVPRTRLIVVSDWRAGL
ncbi:MAG: Tol biopolymer transport system component, partial [Planctomycetota bacterium]